MKKYLLFILFVSFGFHTWSQSFDLTTYQSLLYCEDRVGAKTAGYFYGLQLPADSNFMYRSFFPEVKSISIIDFGSGHFMVDPKNQLWVRGQNNTGLLGFGHRDPVNEFTVHAGYDSISDVSVFLNGLSVIAVQNGKLWLWGFGPRELFANDTTLQGSHLRPLPVFDSLGNIDQVGVGDQHALLLMKDGTVWGWGNANEGRLGDKYVGYLEEPLLLGIRNIQQIAVGLDHSVILDSTGHAYAFGSNSFGQCGKDPDEAYFVQKPTVVPLDSITKIAANRLNTYFIRENGDLYALGVGVYGGIGNGDSAWTYFEPVQVQIPAAVQEIKLSRHGAIAKVASGDFYAFGLDETGQFGQNKTGFSQHTPKRIDPTCATVDVTEHTTSTLTVSPNPSQDGVFSLSGFETSIPWQVYSVLGHRVASGTGSRIDLSSQPAGMYLLMAGEARVKLVVE